jgi:CubicO group peptidase (beta-lactamase class C family)
MDTVRWRQRLDELRTVHDVPAVSLAVLAGGQVTALASGVLNRDTGVEATTDSLFQIGSVTKMYTATLAMRLVEQGLVTVDTPVVEVLPEFRLADPEATRRVTLRQLMCHTSGIDGDHFHDSGRGDDCVAKYVETCAGLEQIHPPGATVSYCNTGFVILGRIVERLTGLVWDQALAQHLAAPLGLTHTWTLPEDVLRFRAAMGHLPPASGGPVRPASLWSLPRAVGPAGLICATASDVVGFARMHLGEGCAPDGTRVLSAATVREMQRPQVRMSHPHGSCNARGLGWELFDWGGRRVFGHEGDTIGQAATLRVVPDADVVVAVLSNSDGSSALHREVVTDLLAELCDLTVPALLEPPAETPPLDPDRYVGVYERAGKRIELSARGGQLWLHAGPTGALADLGLPAYDFPLTALGEDLLVGRPPDFNRWMCYHLDRRPDGAVYLHDGSRATPKVA